MENWEMSVRFEDSAAVDSLLVDSSLYASHDRYHDLFRYLREREPVRMTRPDGFVPFWTVSRYADICEVQRQPALFINEPRNTLLPIAVEERLECELGSKLIMNTMLSMDGAEHQSMRRLGAQYFTPGGVAKLKDGFRRAANHYVDRMADQGSSCDFVQTVSAWYPLRVILQVFGLDESTDHELHLRTREFINSQNPALSAEGKQGEKMLKSWNEFCDYFRPLVADRRANPQNDLASVIANATFDGDPITDRRLFSYYILIVVAGHDTTSTSLGGGMLQLLRDRTQFDRLKADPALIPTAVDEMIRWMAPVKHFLRTATQDYELRGMRISAGETLLMALPSGCYDEEVFDRPFVFDVARKPNKHIAFGFGAHVCLGQYLARLELATFLEVFLERIEDMDLCGTPEESSTLFLGNVDYLPVSYKFKDR
ncbi:cytochrome P450 [Sphingobium sp. TB-6]|uniref:cytochrome P450 n=1 Tax=Sphingobium sp. TB-6 TaxID=2728850 RepID=UPI00146F7C8C|nr:cytochrome P450 [Sphingobium sp. TB-6]NML91762.1 cytochrome P450 [Sphingobium sp. TB-6]